MAHPASASPDTPLTPAHLEAIAHARRRARKLRRAARWALISGWTTAIFAAITICGGLFGDWIALALGVALAVIAFFELRGARGLRRFDLNAPTILALNQLAFAAILVCYGLGMLLYTTRHPIVGGAAAGSGDAEIDAMVGDLSKMIGTVLYGGVAVFGLLGPGLTAWYYQSRAKLVRAYLNETPDWVVAVVRSEE